jgi:uncharacterized protein (TIGR02118 family)
LITVSVFYPRKQGARFDIDYYCDRHIPLVRRELAPALKDVEIHHGLAGAAPNAPPPYVAMVHLRFDSVAAYEKAFETGGAAILADIPNYTDIEPVIQVSDVRSD